MHLELSEVQTSTLSETLESVLSDLSYEIANTDRQDFRERLKARRDVLKGVLETLKVA